MCLDLVSITSRCILKAKWKIIMQTKVYSYTSDALTNFEPKNNTTPCIQRFQSHFYVTYDIAQSDTGKLISKFRYCAIITSFLEPSQTKEKRLLALSCVAACLPINLSSLNGKIFLQFYVGYLPKCVEKIQLLLKSKMSMRQYAAQFFL